MTDRELMEQIMREVRDTRSEMAAVKNEVHDTRLTLENETNKNIQTIAEGHFDLTRKLDEALAIENEKEMMKIRLNILESEVEKLKAKIEQIA